ncbi:MAG: replication initiation protein [Actinobacteria bacterium]|nr:replication initiation protein [Actinomycetota bacterium]
MEDSIVKKSNVLARGRWQTFNIYEGRLVALVASKVRCDDKDFQSYSIAADEIITDNPGGSAYERMRVLADKLMTRVVTIEDEKGWAKYTLFCRCRFDKETSTLDMQIHPDLKPHYLDLQKHFTQYPLIEYLSLPSSYTQKIYEVLRSYDDQQEIRMSINELHDILQTKKSIRRTFAELNRWILKPAHKHITELTSLKYEYEPIKKGRKYTEIRFTFGYKKRQETKKKNTKNNSKKQVDIFNKAKECWQEKGKQCDSKSQSQKCNICKLTVQLSENKKAE